MINPLERLEELRKQLSDLDSDEQTFEQSQIMAEAVLIGVEAQAHQADALSRIADYLEVIAANK